MIKRILKTVAVIITAAVIAFAGLLIYLTATDYRPEPVETVALNGTGTKKLNLGDSLSLLSFNIGYCGLDAGNDFFMDGGKNVLAASEEQVMSNLAGITGILEKQNVDVVFLQEVDRDAKRSYGVNEVAHFAVCLDNASAAFAVNYRCRFVPYPWPPMGRVEGGIQTLNRLSAESVAERIALPGSFSWPVSICQLKRCLLVERVPIEGSDKELVLINLHLEAYDSGGTGRIAQTEQLFRLLEEEYGKGNYVIAGGDFNQTFDTVSPDRYPIRLADGFVPGSVDTSALGEGWTFACDEEVPSCRLLCEPYNPDSENTQYYILDGFILSPNIALNQVMTIDQGFVYADHNPVRVEVTLLP